jgi:hypothetical protein
MRFFNKELKAKADNRIAKMETSALTPWMDSTIMNFAVSFDKWRFKDGPKEEVSEALTVLNSVWDELAQRDIH